MRRLFLLALLSATVGGTASAQIPLSEFAERRAVLASQLEDGIFVARGAEEPVMDYLSFYQNAGFLYLTGFREPDAALLLQKRGSDLQWTLFVQSKDPSQEVWSGRRYGPDSAGKATGLATAPTSRFRPVLDSLLQSENRLYVLTDLAEGGDTLNHDNRFVDEIRRAHPNVRIAGANDIVTRMRGKKSVAEMELIRRAAAISMEAHAEAARVLEPGMNEFEIQALIEYTFRRNGADRPAYASIVGSGPNSTVLHYNRDDRFMSGGELLLIDAAASYAGYAADVTRTFPVSGTFTPEQRAIYQIVRDAQAAAEREVRAGAPVAAGDRAVREILAERLAELGLIQSPDATFDPPWGGDCSRPTLRCTQAFLFMAHGLGHGIGLEVHDIGGHSYSPTGVFQEGEVITIEPGIYIGTHLLDMLPDTPKNRAFIAAVRPVVERYANIGVRIEDDYIVTATGAEWISRAPREIEEIEAVMQQRPGT